MPWNTLPHGVLRLIATPLCATELFHTVTNAGHVWSFTALQTNGFPPGAEFWQWPVFVPVACRRMQILSLRPLPSCTGLPCNSQPLLLVTLCPLNLRKTPRKERQNQTWIEKNSTSKQSAFLCICGAVKVSYGNHNGVGVFQPQEHREHSRGARPLQTVPFVRPLDVICHISRQGSAFCSCRSSFPRRLQEPGHRHGFSGSAPKPMVGACWGTFSKWQSAANLGGRAPKFSVLMAPRTRIIILQIWQSLLSATDIDRPSSWPKYHHVYLNTCVHILCLWTYASGQHVLSISAAIHRWPLLPTATRICWVVLR